MPEQVTAFTAGLLGAKQHAAREQKRLRESERRGLGKPLDAAVEVTLQGQTYKVAALIMDDLAELEAWIKSQRLQAVIDASAGLLPGERASVIAKTAAEPVSYLDVLQLRNSPIGCRRIAWLCLRRHQPAISLSQVEVLTPDLDALMTVIGQVSDLFEEENEEGEEKAEGGDKAEGGEEMRPTDDTSPLTFGSQPSAEPTE